MRLSLAALLCLTSLAPAHAAPFEVRVTDASGAPLANAVVTLPAPDGFDPAAAPSDGTLMMAQENLQFKPHVLIVPRGAQVEFPNRDRVRHHVYSFSGRNAFELQLYGREESRMVGFGHPGAVVLGCNIHDDMIGYIRVVETPFAALTSADGAAVFTDAPAGALHITVWHPYATTPDGSVTLEISGQDREAAHADVAIAIRAPG